MALFWILGATFFVTAVSLIGIVTLAVREELLNKVLILLVGFAAGGLIGGAFLHLLPEAIEASKDATVFIYVLLGFLFFFLMERYFYWRHCHDGICDVHAFTYLNLIGDGIHNFVDGLVVAASFLSSIKLGLVTTLAILFHEVPQEIGDFGILLYGGFKKSKALFYNFICGVFAIGGALIGYLLSNNIADFAHHLLPFTAGGFIYIASSDLIPEMHRQKDTRRANQSVVTFLLGILFMWAARFIAT